MHGQGRLTNREGDEYNGEFFEGNKNGKGK